MAHDVSTGLKICGRLHPEDVPTGSIYKHGEDERHCTKRYTYWTYEEKETQVADEALKQAPENPPKELRLEPDELQEIINKSSEVGFKVFRLLFSDPGAGVLVTRKQPEDAEADVVYEFELVEPETVKPESTWDWSDGDVVLSASGYWSALRRDGEWWSTANNGDEAFSDDEGMNDMADRGVVDVLRYQKGGDE